MTDKASPDRPETETPRKWPSWLTAQNVIAVCAVIGVIAVLIGGVYALWSRFDAVFERISETGIDIRNDIGKKLDAQTEAINENTNGLGILEERISGVQERVSGVEEDIGHLKDSINDDVDRLEEKIDGLSRFKQTSY